MDLRPLIDAKRRGFSHTSADLESLVDAVVRGGVHVEQLSAWLMAVCLNGMSPSEIASLTLSMARSGKVLSRQGFQFRVDKHSTGGVGDKTSLLLVPWVSDAANRIHGKGAVAIPMISGRSLGHTGGTLDKLESISGFRVDLDIAETESVLAELGACVVAQSSVLAPADRVLYALRDRTGTVESQALIVASILSKKISESLDGLVMDIKVGSGAFQRTLEEGAALGALIGSICDQAGLKHRICFTRMDEPLGRFVGNGLEVVECARFLQGECRDPGLFEVTYRLAEAMLECTGVSRARAKEALESSLAERTAWATFLKWMQAQGGQWDAFVDQFESSGSHLQSIEIFARGEGVLTHWHPRIVAQVAKGAVEAAGAFGGVEKVCAVGTSLKSGDVVAIVRTSHGVNKDRIVEQMSRAFELGEQNSSPSWVIETGATDGWQSG